MFTEEIEIIIIAIEAKHYTRILKVFHKAFIPHLDSMTAVATVAVAIVVVK
jgi:hypothetical protein